MSLQKIKYIGTANETYTKAGSVKIDITVEPGLVVECEDNIAELLLATGKFEKIKQKKERIDAV